MAGSGGVRLGEGAAKVFGGSQGWRDRDQEGLLEPRRAVIEHGHDGSAGARGLGEPREPRNLVRDPPTAAIRFPDGVHRCGLLSAWKLRRSLVSWRFSARRVHDIKGYARHPGLLQRSEKLQVVRSRVDR